MHVPVMLEEAVGCSCTDQMVVMLMARSGGEDTRQRYWTGFLNEGD